MKRAVLVAIALMTAACSQQTPTASVTPVPSTTTPAPSASASAAEGCTPSTSSYGLIIAAGSLQVIDTCAKVKASAPLANGSVTTCSTGIPAQLAAPVSATNDKIYFRDGDTKIRFLTPDGATGDATTVPGSATSVSFFSVSPDDARIAVLVEDLSGAATMGLRLYVEDVQGGGHHVDIYSATVAKDGGTTLWPMGWHAGNLVVAVMPACGTPPGFAAPTSWHVADPATGNRVAQISSPCQGNPQTPGILSRWPSPAGVACVGFGTGIAFYDWNGKVTAWKDAFINTNNAQSAVSPSGSLFVAGASDAGCGSSEVGAVCIFSIGEDGPGITQHFVEQPCLFIDDSDLLTPASVITVGSNTADESVLPAKGQCAGRFPGGL